jgi:glycosyltransferase involved in cell wall biosynthesis
VPIDISIIIPLYNKEEYIVNTLKSVLYQDAQNWECIIVNDGSTDGSLNAANDFCKTHPGNWRIISVLNGGQTKARNIGIRESSGKYLAFLDADDLWVTNKLSKQFKYLEAHPAVIGVLSGYAIFSSKFKRIRVVRSTNFNKMLKNWASMRGFGGGLESVGMVRRNTNRGEIFFDENLSTSSGLDFTIRCSQLGIMVVLDDIGLLYRLSNGQWHTNIDELSANMSIISEKYSGYFKMDLHTRHLDYYFWVEVRKHGHAHLLRAILGDLAHLRVLRLQMLYWLLFRNIKAIWIGRLSRRYVLRQLRILNS